MRTFEIEREYTVTATVYVEARDRHEAELRTEAIDLDQALKLERCGEADITVTKEFQDGMGIYSTGSVVLYAGSST